jgi:hypothetical protein
VLMGPSGSVTMTENIVSAYFAAECASRNAFFRPGPE